MFEEGNVVTSESSSLIIDVHSHFMPSNLPDFSSRYGYSGFASLTIEEESANGHLRKGTKELGEVPSAFWNIQERKDFMAMNGIDVQVLVPPSEVFSYWAKADDTADLCRIVNNSLKQEADKFPHSFVPLFIVPMQAPELAVVEVERCVKLGFKACAIGTHVNEWNLDAKELVPFWESCEENNVSVFVHANEQKMMRKDRNYWLKELIGAPHAMNRAVTTTLLGGVLEQFPKLKLCFADGGGSFPYLHGRIEQAFNLKPEVCATQTELPPSTFLDKFYCDAVVGSSHAMELLVKVMGSQNILFGTNFPLVPTTLTRTEKGKLLCKNTGKGFVQMCDLKSEDEENVFFRNAVRFLDLNLEAIKKIDR